MSLNKYLDIAPEVQKMEVFTQKLVESGSSFDMM